MGEHTYENEMWARKARRAARVPGAVLAQHTTLNRHMRRMVRKIVRSERYPVKRLAFELSGRKSRVANEHVHAAIAILKARKVK